MKRIKYKNAHYNGIIVQWCLTANKVLYNNIIICHSDLPTNNYRFSPMSDQYQYSPNNIHTTSREMVAKINQEIITKGKYFDVWPNSLHCFLIIACRSDRRICMQMSCFGPEFWEKSYPKSNQPHLLLVYVMNRFSHGGYFENAIIIVFCGIYCKFIWNKLTNNNTRSSPIQISSVELSRWPI